MYIRTLMKPKDPKKLLFNLVYSQLFLSFSNFFWIFFFVFCIFCSFLIFYFCPFLIFKIFVFFLIFESFFNTFFLWFFHFHFVFFVILAKKEKLGIKGKQKWNINNSIYAKSLVNNSYRTLAYILK